MKNIYLLLISLLLTSCSEKLTKVFISVENHGDFEVYQNVKIYDSNKLIFKGYVKNDYIGDYISCYFEYETPSDSLHLKIESDSASANYNIKVKDSLSVSITYNSYYDRKWVQDTSQSMGFRFDSTKVKPAFSLRLY